MKLSSFGCVLFSLLPMPAIAQEFPRLPRPIQNGTDLDRNDKLDFPTIQKTSPTPLEPQPQISLPTPSVEVVQFQIEGSTVFTETEIQTLLEDFVGQSLEDRDLAKIETVVTDYYADSGFLEVSAFVSAIDLLTKDSNRAIITLQVFERVVSDIEILGAGRLTPFILKRFQKYLNQPFNTPELTNELRFLLEQDTVDIIQAAFIPAELENEGILRVNVGLGDIVEGTVNLNNNQSPSTGEIEGSFLYVDHNLGGLGDELNLQFRGTEGSRFAGATYEFPVNADDGTISVNASFARSSVIQEPTDEFDLDAETVQFGASFRQPILQISNDSKTQEVALGIGIDHIHTQESLDDIPFPLSSGTRIDGKFRSTVLNLFQEYSRKGKRIVLLVRSNLDIGLPIGSMNDPFFGDGSFISAGLQGILFYRLNNRIGLFSRWNGQIGDRTLTSREQFSLGGLDKVRGVNLSADRDSGITFSQEIRILLFLSKDHQLELAPFFNIGYAGNQSQLVFQENLTVASSGIAVRYQFADHVLVSFEQSLPVLGRESFRDSSDFKFSVTGRIF